jgi:hypothetical protein
MRTQSRDVSGGHGNEIIDAGAMVVAAGIVGKKPLRIGPVTPGPGTSLSQTASVTRLKEQQEWRAT